MNKTTLFICLIFLLSACNLSVDSTSDIPGDKEYLNFEENKEYMAILIFDYKKYNFGGVVEENKYKISNEAGIVELKVSPDTMPKSNLSSNFLEEGTVVYRQKKMNQFY